MPALLACLRINLSGMPGEQACAVTASSVGVHTSAMRQPDQSLERTVYDLARCGSADLGD